MKVYKPSRLSVIREVVDPEAMVLVVGLTSVQARHIR